MFFRIRTATIETISCWNRATVFCISLILLVLLGWLDHITGDYSLIVFYLIPVSLMAWFFSRTGGILFCLLASVTRFAADIAPDFLPLQNSELHYWNIFVEFLFLLMMSLLLSTLHNTLKSEKSGHVPPR